MTENPERDDDLWFRLVRQRFDALVENLVKETIEVIQSGTVASFEDLEVFLVDIYPPTLQPAVAHMIVAANPPQQARYQVEGMTFDEPGSWCVVANNLLRHAILEEVATQPDTGIDAACSNLRCADVWLSWLQDDEASIRKTLAEPEAGSFEEVCAEILGWHAPWYRDSVEVKEMLERLWQEVSHGKKPTDSD